ncbi:hypothetical protein VTI74DRAFT_8666 [Chaetomium olivicolor]
MGVDVGNCVTNGKRWRLNFPVSTFKRALPRSPEAVLHVTPRRTFSPGVGLPRSTRRRTSASTPWVLVVLARFLPHPMLPPLPSAQCSFSFFLGCTASWSLGPPRPPKDSDGTGNVEPTYGPAPRTWDPSREGWAIRLQPPGTEIPDGMSGSQKQYPLWCLSSGGRPT